MPTQTPTQVGHNHEKIDGTTAPAFGELLRRYRAAAGLTQEGLAERSGLSVRGISDLERAERTKPHQATVALLATALGLSAVDSDALAAAARRPIDSEQGAGGMGNLPSRLNRFIGRDRELGELRRLLGETRLVTVVGPGGMGKTRLALVLAVAEADPGGAWFVDLASLTSSNLIWDVIAATVGLREMAAVSAQEAVRHHLGNRSCLVLLDSCEHLLAAMAETTSILLRNCGGVLVLATSREPLRIEGEVVWETPPMHEDEALDLFRDRARHHPDGDTEATPPADLAQLVRRLDYMPLAIELAAAQTRAMAIRDLTERLDDRLKLLTRGDRLAVPRQRTLLATLEWSYGLLQEEERRMLESLSVFAGGFTLQSAEQVCTDSKLPSERVPDLVARLVEKSLVHFELSQALGRYRLLEAVRLFAAERLDEHQKISAVRNRHARYFYEVVEQLYRQPRIPQDGPDAMDHVDREHDNVRAALDWWRSADAQAFLQMAEALTFYWDARGYYEEGCEYGAQAVALAARASERQVRLLRSLAVFELSRGNVDYALGYIQEAIQQARQLGNHALVALAIRTQVGILREDGTEPAILLAMSVEAVREGQLGTDGIELAMALYSLGSLRVEIGDVAEGRADLESALPLLEAALRLGETRKTLGFRGGVLLSLARAVYLQGDRERARELWCESLAIEHSVGERFWAARSIEGLAHLMADSEPVSALVLGAGVIKLWQERGLPLPKSVQDGVGWVEQTRASLPPQVAAKALSDGRAMRFDALVAAALSSCKGESV